MRFGAKGRHLVVQATPKNKASALIYRPRPKGICPGPFYWSSAFPCFRVTQHPKPFMRRHQAFYALAAIAV